MLTPAEKGILAGRREAAARKAAEAYAEHRRDIAAMLDWLEMALGTHEEAATAEPEKWTFAGDLAEVRRRLLETLAFLSGHDEPEIEQALDELRL
jgi:hypothetical protein